MHHPPKRQKHHHYHALQAVQLAHMALFPLPATTLPILKGRLDPHAPAILLDAFAPGRPVGNQKPGLFLTLFPHGTQWRLLCLVLPKPHRAKAGLTGLADDLPAGLPVLEVAIALALNVLLLFAT
jgi:hypothetical protein